MRRVLSRKILIRSLAVTALVTAAVSLVGPLTYDERAHRVLNDATRAFAPLGDQLLGLDLTAPRQNLFSLVRDLDRIIVIVDHGTVLRSQMLGLANFASRGAISTVSDALRSFDVMLTTRQARGILPCRKLDILREGEEIIVQSDPYQYGVASWYGPGFHGRVAASGEIFSTYERTAAHRTLPLQTMVRVVSQRTGNSTIVRINDRGPYVGGRVIDLSHRSKQLLGMDDLAAVYLERINPTALDGPCDE